jgi:hypothetical protein
MPGQVLLKGEHQIYTNRWLAWFGRRNMATYRGPNVRIDEIAEAVLEIYADQPAMYRVLLPYLA